MLCGVHIVEEDEMGRGGGGREATAAGGDISATAVSQSV